VCTPWLCDAQASKCNDGTTKQLASIRSMTMV
jgi:hypothetical protein